MNKYLILYVAPVSAEAQMNFSPEEMKKRMEPWEAWQKKNAKAIVDFGSPVKEGACVDKKGSSKSKTEVRGFSILQAKDLDALKSIIADNPHLTMTPKASIEVLEFMSM